ncbi:MAG: hypothetical protein NUV52_01605 [Candidatus Roizmanbacteria bacterium]|nr:hypothetical protein [Candidatus Roizmanbacteria bacterium]
MALKDAPSPVDLLFLRAPKEALFDASQKVLTVLDTYMALHNMMSIPVILEPGTRYCVNDDATRYVTLGSVLEATLPVWSIGPVNKTTGIQTRLVQAGATQLYVDRSDLVESLYTHSPSVTHLQRALDSAYDRKAIQSLNLLQRWQIRSN